MNNSDKFPLKFLYRSRKLLLFLQLILYLLLAIAFWHLTATPRNTTALNENVQMQVTHKIGVTKTLVNESDITLIAENGTARVRLIDNHGKTINLWEVDAERARLLPDGHLLVIHGSKWGRSRNPWKKLRRTVREYSWDGDVVWEYTAPDIVHHDLHRLPNGNTIFLMRSLLPREKTLQISDASRRKSPVRADAVVEVNRVSDIISRWDIFDSFSPDYCGRRGCNYLSGRAGAARKISDWTHVNTLQLLPANQWYKRGDERFKPGNLLIQPRNWWTFIIIDRESGKAVWEYHGHYRGGISGGHDAHMIPEGLPGAGNILVFDNGTETHKGESIILEINPHTNEIVWKYEDGTHFFSKTRGAVQRLPNGNTFISEDLRGRCFEVTKEGKIVWEYISPVEINRARRYPLEYCPVCAKN